MKSSTYVSVATIVFVKHRDQVSKSIESVIRITDKICKIMKLKNDLSHMTRYREIIELMDSGILDDVQTQKNIKLRRSKDLCNIIGHYII